jgi:hypothetical protein
MVGLALRVVSTAGGRNKMFPTFEQIPYLLAGFLRQHPSIRIAYVSVLVLTTLVLVD